MRILIICFIGVEQLVEENGPFLQVPATYIKLVRGKLRREINMGLGPVI
jgi:hypothetical protein